MYFSNVQKWNINNQIIGVLQHDNFICKYHVQKSKIKRG